MSKLLSAYFARLWKNKMFWVLTAGMFFYGASIQLFAYLDASRSGYIISMTDNLFAYSMPLLFLMAAFVSLFLGTEHSDGTIRNKLIVGHTRAAVYLSSLILCIAAGCILILAFLLPAGILGIVLMKSPEGTLVTTLINLADSIVLIIAVSAILTMLSVLNQNKAAVAVTGILGMLGMFVVVFILFRSLDAPEFLPSYTIGEGSPAAEMVPNPNYLTDAKRSVYQFIFDFLPAGQAYHIASGTAAGVWQLPLYSLLITAVTTLWGVLAFRRKDLK